MRALLVLALLVSMAQADEDYDPLIELRRSFEWHDGYGCQDHLAALRANGVPDATTINFFQRRDISRGLHSLAELRLVCEKHVREHTRDQAAALIGKAIEFPWVWAEECVTRWQVLLASGVDPTARVLIGTRSRRGFVRVEGTLEQLYVKHCENAYTPRRRSRAR